MHLHVTLVIIYTIPASAMYINFALPQADSLGQKRFDADTFIRIVTILQSESSGVNLALLALRVLDKGPKKWAQHGPYG